MYYLIINTFFYLGLAIGLGLELGLVLLLGLERGYASFFFFISDEFIYHTYHLLKFHSYTFLQSKSNFNGKLNAVALFGKDESVLSNQNT